MSDNEEELLPAKKIRRLEHDSELLPLKVDGKIIRRFRAKETAEAEIKQEVGPEKKPTDLIKEERELSVHELLVEQKKLLEKAKLDISTAANSLVHDPQEHYGKLRQLYKQCMGDEVDELVRESVQRMAIASLTEVFISIVPGYPIRPLTEEEQKQKMKADTRKIHQFETSLLNNYQKFVSLLENNAIKLNHSEKHLPFATKMGVLSTKCLRKLLTKLSHFNCASEIVACLVRLAISSNQVVLEESCLAICEAFADDNTLSISMDGVKAIAEIVNKKKGYVTPQLLSTFLHLNIKAISRSAINPKAELPPTKRPTTRISKQMRKKNKRLNKKEEPLREAEAAVRLSVLSHRATDTMKYVFMTYFRILKRMPSTALLGPVLEGLSKFAHLINVDFFDDLVKSLSSIVDQKHVKFIDSLRCVKTVCIILSGEGQALNIDPLKFYNTLYAILPSLAFQEESDLATQMQLLIDSLDLLIIKRRRLISVKRVASYAKRLFLIGLLLPANCLIALLSILRKIFIAFPGLSSLIESNDEEVIANGLFLPDSSDPDCSNAMSSNVVAELTRISKFHNKAMSAYANNILHQLPSSGLHKLNGQFTSLEPADWLKPKDNDFTEYPFKAAILKFCQHKKITMTSSNLCSTVQKFLEQ